MLMRQHDSTLIIKNIGKSDINERYICECGFSFHSKLLRMDEVFEDELTSETPHLTGRRTFPPQPTKNECQDLTQNTYGNTDLVEPTPPKNFKAIAVDNTIIVKWTVENPIRFDKKFGVEYREYFEPYWRRMTVENKSTVIIDRLRPGTVYFVRGFSMTAVSESNRTDEIIVKTDKQHSMVNDISVEFAVIAGALHLTMFLCWCGTRGWKNRKSFCKNKDRVTPSRIHEDSSVRPDHYEEIESMYYNPHNVTVTRQDTNNSPQFEILQASINNGNNFESCETNNHSSQSIIPCASHQFEYMQENSATRSSSDDSYLVPCSNYIDFDLEKITINEHQEIRKETNETRVLDESSISSNDSETDLKSIRKYETLKLSDVHEHSYERYNEPDA